MIFRRQIISGSAGPIFAIFSPNENVLGADDRSGPHFPISQGTLPWQPILCRKQNTNHSLAVRINSANDATILHAVSYTHLTLPTILRV